MSELDATIQMLLLTFDSLILPKDFFMSSMLILRRASSFVRSSPFMTAALILQAFQRKNSGGNFEPKFKVVPWC
jgi:hypothetical protein